MRLIEGANLFSFLSLLLAAGLFVLGNYQEFLDSSQVMLLGIVSTLAMLSVASGICYFVALVIWMIRRRHLMIGRVIYALLATSMAASIVVAGGALEAVIRPA